MMLVISGILIISIFVQVIYCRVIEGFLTVEVMISLNHFRKLYSFLNCSFIV